MEPSYEDFRLSWTGDESPVTPSKPREDLSDITDPGVRRERFFSQDKRILEAVGALATKVKSCPVELGYPEHEPSALVVGGFARDSLIGKFPKDADLEVYGVSALRLESLLDQLYGDRLNKVGKAFYVFKVALGDGLDLDISMPRRESKIGPGHTGFEMIGDPTMSIHEAARRRDFTINALAVDPLTGLYEDHFGGVADLRSKTLRMTDEERFQDDPLRVYRAVQFTARMGLRVEEKTNTLMKEMVARGDLRQLKQERVTEEWKKLFLKAKRPSIGLELAKELGIIARVYPELNATASWENVKRLMDEAARVIHESDRKLTESMQVQVMLAALCVHASPAEKVVQQLLAKFTFSKKEILSPTGLLVKEHLTPDRIWRACEAGELTPKQGANEVRKTLKRVHPVSLEALLALSEADTIDEEVAHLSEAPRVYPPADLFRAQAERHPEWLDPKKAVLITGEDMAAMGVPPGPEMGRLARLIEDARDRGEIETREEAMSLLRVSINK